MYYFIVNPKSRSGKGMNIWGRVHQSLLRENIAFQCAFTKYRGHAKKLAYQLSDILTPEDILAVIGVDGTINEVVNGIKIPDNVTLGYVPTGSGNDFSRGVGIPADTAAAIQLLLHPPQTKKIDLGLLQINHQKRLFTISCGLGFDACICCEALTSPFKKVFNALHLGKLTYAVIAIKQLFSFRTADMELELDDSRHVSLKNVYFAAVMNLPYEGGGFRFCPAARNADRVLDVIAVANMPKWKVLLLFPTAYFGKHTRIRGIHIFRCRQIYIKSHRKYPAHTDGEFSGVQHKLFVSLSDTQLNVITQ